MGGEWQSNGKNGNSMANHWENLNGVHYSLLMEDQRNIWVVLISIKF